MKIRLYQPSDKTQLTAIALQAFAQFKGCYSDWSVIENAVASMADFADAMDIFVAEESGKIVGGVVYMPPLGEGLPNQGYFDSSWAVIRMLVVAPEFRGKGIGKQLTLACLQHAKNNGLNTVALHTSPIMEVALAMYLKIGFSKVKDINPILGVDYAIYKYTFS